jgi:aminopeptidase N
LRDFSAPVILDYNWRDEDLSHLLAHDSDPFNRWEAGQRLASRLILAAAVDIAAGRPAHWPLSFAEAAAAGPAARRRGSGLRRRSPDAARRSDAG